MAIASGFEKLNHLHYNIGMIRMMTLIALCCALPLSASAQQLVGSYGDWRVFTVERDGKQTCYIASQPSKKEGTYTKRGDPYLLVTHKSGAQDEVSVSAGYTFKNKSEAKLAFGQKSHMMFVKDELAWAYDEAADRAIVKDMIRGSKLVVHGTSWKGTKSQDTYSLSGFTDAHREMKRQCK